MNPRERISELKKRGLALWEAAGLGVVRHSLMVAQGMAGHGKREEGVKVEVVELKLSPERSSEWSPEVLSEKRGSAPEVVMGCWFGGDERGVGDGWSFGEEEKE